MLILTRRPGETIFINTPSGDEISVTFLSFNGRQAKIGINAPKEYNIVRAELLSRGKDAGEGFKQMEASGYVSEKQTALDQQGVFESLKQGQSLNPLDGGQPRKRVFSGP